MRYGHIHIFTCTNSVKYKYIACGSYLWKEGEQLINFALNVTISTIMSGFFFFRLLYWIDVLAHWGLALLVALIILVVCLAKEDLGYISQRYDSLHKCATHKVHLLTLCFRSLREEQLLLLGN